MRKNKLLIMTFVAIAFGLTSIAVSAGVTRSGSGGRNTFGAHSHASNMSFHGNAKIGYASISRDNGSARSRNGGMTHAVVGGTGTPSTKMYSHNFTTKNGTSYNASGTVSTTGTGSLHHEGVMTNQTTGQLVHNGFTSVGSEGAGTALPGFSHAGDTTSKNYGHSGKTTIVKDSDQGSLIQHDGGSYNVNTYNSHTGSFDANVNTSTGEISGQKHGTLEGDNYVHQGSTYFATDASFSEHYAIITNKNTGKSVDIDVVVNH